jgi:hypothetical protein
MTPTAITNDQRCRFMQALATNVRGANGLLLSPWENGFLTTFLRNSHPSSWFIGGRIKSTDALWRKHGHEIGMPFPLAGQSASTISKADPGCCMFYVKDADDGGRLRHCNDPAVVCNQHGFLYCKAHEEAVQRDLRRRTGKTMILTAYKPE